MNKFLDNLIKVFVFTCMFVSPLIFFTDFTHNPYQIQIFLSAAGALFLVFILSFRFFKKGEFSFLLSRADIAIFAFIFLVLFSLIINSFISSTPQALLNEFWRRGFVLISSIFCGYFCARLFCNTDNFLNFEEGKNYKTGISFFVWGLCWLPFSYFRMKGLFDIYGLLMWGSAFYLGIKFLDKINLRKILDLLLIAGALESIYGICQNLGYEFLWTTGVGMNMNFGSNIYASFGNPNFLSSFIILILPVGIIFLLLAQNKFSKTYYFLINLLLIICLSLTGARSSFIGIFCGILFLFLYASFRKKLFENKKTIFLFIGILLFLFSLWPAHKDSEYKKQDTQIITQSIFSSPQNLTLAAPKEAIRMSYHQRLMAWTCGFENIAKSPLIGGGWGSWQLNYAPCQGRLLKKYPALKSLRTQSNSAHNIFIEVLSESGILGLLAFLTFLFLVFWIFQKVYLREKDTSKKLYYLMLCAAGVGFLVDNTLNITFQNQIESLIFYFFIGILASLKTEKKEIKKDIAVISVILAGFLLTVVAFKQGAFLLSSYYSYKGYKETKGDNLSDAKKDLKKAISLSSESVDTYFAYIKALEFSKDISTGYEALLETLNYYPFYYEFYNIKVPFEISFNRPQQAFDDLKISLGYNPYHELSLKNLLNLLVTFKELRTLQNAAFIESLNLPISYQNAYNMIRAQIYAENNLSQKARQIFLEELAKNKYDKSIQENLAEVDKYLGIKEDLALKDALVLSDLRNQLMQEKEISPFLIKKLQDIAQKEDLEGNMLLAQAYFKQKDYQKSREILTSIYQKYSDFMPLNFAFASLEQASGNKEEAKKYLLNILSKDENNSLALQRLNALN